MSNSSRTLRGPSPVSASCSWLGILFPQPSKPYPLDCPYSNFLSLSGFLPDPTGIEPSWLSPSWISAFSTPNTTQIVFTSSVCMYECQSSFCTNINLQTWYNTSSQHHDYIKNNPNKYVFDSRARLQIQIADTHRNQNDCRFKTKGLLIIDGNVEALQLGANLVLFKLNKNLKDHATLLSITLVPLLRQNTLYRPVIELKLSFNSTKEILIELIDIAKNKSTYALESAIHENPHGIPLIVDWSLTDDIQFRTNNYRLVRYLPNFLTNLSTRIGQNPQFWLLPLVSSYPLEWLDILIGAEIRIRYSFSFQNLQTREITNTCKAFKLNDWLQKISSSSFSSRLNSFVVSQHLLDLVELVGQVGSNLQNSASIINSLVSGRELCLKQKAEVLATAGTLLTCIKSVCKYRSGAQGIKSSTVPKLRQSTRLDDQPTPGFIPSPKVGNINRAKNWADIKTLNELQVVDHSFRTGKSSSNNIWVGFFTNSLTPPVTEPRSVSPPLTQIVSNPTQPGNVGSSSQQTPLVSTPVNLGQGPELCELEMDVEGNDVNIDAIHAEAEQEENLLISEFFEQSRNLAAENYASLAFLPPDGTIRLASYNAEWPNLRETNTSTLESTLIHPSEEHKDVLSEVPFPGDDTTPFGGVDAWEWQWLESEELELIRDNLSGQESSISELIVSLERQEADPHLAEGIFDSIQIMRGYDSDSQSMGESIHDPVAPWLWDDHPDDSGVDDRMVNMPVYRDNLDESIDSDQLDYQNYLDIFQPGHDLWGVHWEGDLSSESDYGPGEHMNWVDAPDSSMISEPSTPPISPPHPGGGGSEVELDTAGSPQTPVSVHLGGCLCNLCIRQSPLRDNPATTYSYPVDAQNLISRLKAHIELIHLSVDVGRLHHEYEAEAEGIRKEYNSGFCVSEYTETERYDTGLSGASTPTLNSVSEMYLSDTSIDIDEVHRKAEREEWDLISWSHKLSLHKVTTAMVAKNVEEVRWEKWIEWHEQSCQLPPIPTTNVVETLITEIELRNIAAKGNDSLLNYKPSFPP